ncbi:MAG: hypothetical protein L6Q57_07055 [Alphaproteobacteria bacterium]|nr:hypothetical protein [Alphaproteobacteria bacterium]
MADQPKEYRNSADKRYVSGAIHGHSHMIEEEYNETRANLQKLQTTDPVLFNKLKDGKDLGSNELKKLGELELSADPKGATAGVLREWKAGNFSPAHKPAFMLAHEGRPVTPEFHAQQIARAEKAVTHNAGTVAKGLGKKGGIVVAAAVGTIAAGQALASTGSLSEAGQTFTDTAIPYGEATRLMINGDQDAAAKSAVIENAGNLGALGGAAAGAGAGALIGSVIPGVGTVIGGVVGGIAGSIGGGMAGGETAERSFDITAINKDIADDFQPGQIPQSYRSSIPRLSNYQQIHSAANMVSPFLDSDKIVGPVERNERGVVTNFFDIDWSNIENRIALNEAFEKAIAKQEALVQETDTWLMPDAKHGEAKLDLKILESAQSEVGQYTTALAQLPQLKTDFNQAAPLPFMPEPSHSLGLQSEIGLRTPRQTAPTI